MRGPPAPTHSHRRGGPAGESYACRTGLGWVAATTNHDYADAQCGKGNQVVLFIVTASSGAAPQVFVKSLHALSMRCRVGPKFATH